MEPPVAKAYRKAIAKVRLSLTEQELAHVVQTGDLRPILDKLDLTDFRLAVRESLLEAASHGSLPFDVRFDALDPWAIRAINTAEFSLVQGVTSGVAEGIRTFLRAGLQNGVNPNVTAISIRNVIGLDARGAQSLFNYEQLLTGGAKGQPYREALRRATRDGRFDRTLLRAIEEKVPLKPSQIAAQLKRFEERAIKLRSETIARTETMDALYRAHMLRWQQAIDQGKVDEDELRRFWHTARDERTCPICRAIPLLNPDGVAFNQPFVLADGSTLMGPTAHPNCRCVVFTRIVFNKGRLTVSLRKMAMDLSGLRSAA